MSSADGSGLGDYVIQVRSHLDHSKRYWFEGLAMTTGYDEDGRPITLLTGHLADQAALHGVLATIRDMNLPLISVRRAAQGQLDPPKSDKTSSNQGGQTQDEIASEKD